MSIEDAISAKIGRKCRLESFISSKISLNLETDSEFKFSTKKTPFNKKTFGKIFQQAKKIPSN